MPADFDEAQLKNELAALASLLGDTRVRYRHGQTQFASAQVLTELDRDIRSVLLQPLSNALQLEVRRLSARLHEIDPR